jgi:truncated hemoglobin YjbI
MTTRLNHPAYHSHPAAAPSRQPAGLVDHRRHRLTRRGSAASAVPPKQQPEPATSTYTGPPAESHHTRWKDPSSPMLRYADSTLLYLTVLAMAVGLLVVFALILRTMRGRSGPADRPPAGGSRPIIQSPSRRAIGRPQPVNPDQLYRGEPPSRILAPGPTVDTPTGRVSLLEWLIHLRGAEVWASVVATFYQRAAADPQVAAYFTGIDLVDLQRHFIRALKIIAEHGVTVGLVRNLHQRHANVRNKSGEPITGDIWDTVVAVLATVLAEQGVPPRTLVVLATTLAPLRAAIVGGGTVATSGEG